MSSKASSQFEEFVRTWQAILPILKLNRVRTFRYAPRKNDRGWRIYLSSISDEPSNDPKALINESMFWILESGDMKYVHMISNFNSWLISFTEVTVTAANWDDIWENITLVEMPSGIFRTHAEPNNALASFLRNVAIDHCIPLPRATAQ